MAGDLYQDLFASPSSVTVVHHLKTTLNQLPPCLANHPDVITIENASHRKHHLPEPHLLTEKPPVIAVRSPTANRHAPNPLEITYPTIA